MQQLATVTADLTFAGSPIKLLQICLFCATVFTVLFLSNYAEANKSQTEVQLRHQVNFPISNRRKTTNNINDGSLPLKCDSEPA